MNDNAVAFAAALSFYDKAFKGRRSQQVRLMINNI